MRRSAQEHPSFDRLRAFAQGRLLADDSARLEEHLADCPDCCASLAHIPNDTLGDLVRGAETPAVDRCPPGLTTGAAKDSLADVPGDAEFDIDPEPPAYLVPTPAPDAVPAALTDHPRYRVVRGLGSGGMGAVFEAEHRLMERRVALKVIHPHLLAHPAAAERFRREAKVAARLHHPNVVQAFDAEEAGSLHFLVMEYIDGRALSDESADRGPLPAVEACGYVRQALAGLAHAHEKGMVHRDLKPQNLMRAADGTIKVLDFGLASFTEHRAGGGPGLTGSHVIMGTPDYMAPEQADDSRGADVRADVYSLGCTLYQLLAGKLPFVGDSTMTKLIAHRTAEPQPLEELRPDLPAGLAAAVRRMMAKSPADRPQTPAEAADLLAPFCAADAAPEPAPAARRPRRLAAVAVAVVAVLLASGLGAAVVLRMQTDRGEVALSTSDPDVELTALPGGKLVRVTDRKSGQGWQLDADKYTLAQADRPGGLAIDLPEGTFTLRRGDAGVLTVTRTHAEKPAPPLTRPALPPRPDGPFDRLRHDAVPAAARALLGGGDPAKAPPDIVAVLGDAAYRVPQSRTRAYWSPDGKLVAVPQRDHVRLLDAETGLLVRRTETAGDWCYRVAFSPDGRLMATGNGDATVRLWDVATGKHLHAWEAYGPAACPVVFGPGGKWVAAGTLEGKTFVWDVATRRPVGTWPDGAAPTAGLSFAPDGRLAIGHGDGQVSVREGASGKLLYRLRAVPHPEGGTGVRLGVAFDREGKRLAAADHTRGVVWPADDGAPAKPLWSGDILGADLLTFLPDGGPLMAARTELDDPLNLHEIQVGTYDDAGKRVRKFDVPLLGLSGSLELSPDGTLLAGMGRGDSVVRLFDAGTGEPVRKGRGPTGYCTPESISPDGEWVATGGWDRLVRLWRPATGEEVVLRGHGQAVRNVVFAPDGKSVATASWDGTVRVWGLDGRELAKFEQDGLPNCVTFSPDGKLLASTPASPDVNVRLWDVGGKKLRAELPSSGRSLLFHPSGDRLAVGRHDGKIRVYAVENVRMLAELPGGGGGPVWTTPSAVELATDAEGRVLVSCGHEPAVRFWRWDGGEARPPLKYDGQGAEHLGLSADGKVFVWSDTDTFVRASGPDGPPRPIFSSCLGGRVRLTRDGRHAVVAHQNGMLCLVRLPAAVPEAAKTP